MATMSKWVKICIFLTFSSHISVCISKYNGEKIHIRYINEDHTLMESFTPIHWYLYIGCHGNHVQIDKIFTFKAFSCLFPLSSSNDRRENTQIKYSNQVDAF